MLTQIETSNYLFCHNSLLSNTVIDVALELEKEYSGRIIDYKVRLGNIHIINDSLEDTIVSNFKSRLVARILKRDYFQDGILLISNRETAKHIIQKNNGAFRDKVLALQEKNEWYTLAGRNKLEYLLQKCELSKADRAKITAFIKLEGFQFKALIGLSHILPWFISRMNNNAAYGEMLKKQPRWF
ncbi:hypothetical protein I4641_09450 [Waterburya agarophytonicola K14]|uniref:Uncharacterized protein n=1 Tax=Waterburya agarophytonicola KI4 TaxID=2874699 RepID=A0A964BQU6_9CYAN|nr:hypothetical protein [Waterburya agarophytonicola]MCC0177201.1 hypothetical protein [Waterburya agarophytonicola KI4]